MELIIELPGRGGQGLELQKFSTDKITIGRGLDNDLILGDPHVCAHHAVLELSESGEIVLTDLGSVNGSKTGKHDCTGKACTIESGDELILGKTRIRVYRPDHVVPASIQLTWVEKVAHELSKPWLTAALCALLIMFTMYSQFNNELSDFNIGREFLTAMGVLIVFALWPTGWSLFARYKKHDARFLAQLSVTIVFVILFSILEKLEAWLAFHYGANIIIDGIGLLISLVMVLVLIWLHYYLSIFLSNKKRWLYSFAMTTLFAGVIFVASTIDNDSFTSRPEYTSNLFPPSVSFYSTQTIDEYLKDTEEIFQLVQEEAGHDE